MRKALTFASLSLAIAFLLPASALGAAKGTDLPAKVTFSATSVFDFATFTFHSEGTMLVSHLGESRLQSEGSLVLTGFNTFDQSDSWVATAANGDELFGVDAEKGVGLPVGGLLAGNTETMVQTITGGTGRFANATGTLTGRFKSVLVSLAWPIGTYSLQGSSEGRVSY